MRSRDITLAYILEHNEGPMLTPYDVARVSKATACPVSHETVRRDCERGEILSGERRPRGTLFEYRITFQDAKRYLSIKCVQCVA
jgi:hypothetical protein